MMTAPEGDFLVVSFIEGLVVSATYHCRGSSDLIGIRVVIIFHLLSDVPRHGLSALFHSSGNMLHEYADVYLIPMFSDNYGFILVNKGTADAAIIDPVRCVTLTCHVPVRFPPKPFAQPMLQKCMEFDDRANRMLCWKR